MSPAPKNIVLLILALAVLGLAGWFFFRKDPEAGYPDDPGTRTHWVCTRCEKHVELTAREFHEWFTSRDKMLRDPDKPKQVIFRCPGCQEFTVRRAVHCGRHSLWFAEADAQGELVNCPQCQKEMAQP